MPKVEIPPFRPIYPTPAALITCVAPDGTPNIITLGEVYNLGLRSPTIVGIGIHKARYSHELISKTREYVVNLPTAKMVKVVDQCGCVSGRDTDKFSSFGLTPVPADKVKPPLIAECPMNIECRAIDIQEIGDHDLFLGEVVAKHVAEDALDADGTVIVSKLDPLCYVHGQYWSCGEFLGHHGAVTTTPGS